MDLRRIAIAAILMALPSAAWTNGLLAQEASKLIYIQSDSLIIAQRKDSNVFLAYSKKSGKWNRFEFPAGVTAVPVVSGGVCAFQTEGDAIHELVAVDSKGNWQTSKLAAPARQCVPIVSELLAVFVVDGQAHAFSGKLGKWDSIEARATPEVSRDLALIVTADSIAAFGVATGKWALADTSR